MPIRRDIPLPLYYQVKQDIMEKIDKGAIELGTRLPSEYELCDIYKVSRITIVRALDELARDGVVRRIPGKGTVVIGLRVEQGVLELSSFTEVMQARGIQSEAVLLEYAIIPCTPSVSAKLEVEPGAEAVFMRRLRLADGEPIGLNTNYLLKSMFSDEVLSSLPERLGRHQSLYAILNELGCRPSSGVERYLAIALDEEQSALLNVPAGSPALFQERVGYLGSGTAIEVSQSVNRGDRYALAVRLARRAD